MKRQGMTLSAAVVIAAAVAAIAGTVVAQARTGTESRPGQVSTTAALPVCPTATICAFSGANATGTEEDFATSAHHSAWISFKSVIGFNPASIIDNSGSDIWVYDQANAAAGSSIAGPYCAFGTSLREYTFTDWTQVNGGTSSQGYAAMSYKPDSFFIQYGVNTCATETPAPPA